jgi:acylphosphatase
MSMDPARVRARVLVRGRVQGVWFRQSTADAARALGVDGWARNLDDGRVEAVFEGTAASVGSALDYVRTGPERARVDDVEISYEPPTGETGFAVR